MLNGKKPRSLNASLRESYMHLLGSVGLRAEIRRARHRARRQGASKYKAPSECRSPVDKEDYKLCFWNGRLLSTSLTPDPEKRGFEQIQEQFCEALVGPGQDSADRIARRWLELSKVFVVAWVLLLLLFLNRD